LAGVGLNFTVVFPGGSATLGFTFIGVISYQGLVVDLVFLLSLGFVI
jgi:hypothetical protein